jgi:TolB-like protein/tetratricopeptide (TPR) repeat protein
MVPTPLTAERWRKIESVFQQAVGLDESTRPQVLARLCERDHELREEVAAMLAAADRENISAPKSQPRAIDLAGRRVGNYRLDRLLGQGGMGSVYLASRADGQFEQQVAVKLLAAWLRGEFFTDRFRVERQALANLNHPNVTRLLDSGITPEGDPYLVMEYVDGQPIDEYCDRHRLEIQDRIRLFLQVCEAVECAHRNRIVHRDLKPANVFVARGGVKLLDFGTAKLLTLAEGDITRTRFLMMTPRYASPEQLRGEAADRHTDVYSLGIVLYELLTGAWPFGEPTSALAGLERAIRDVDPLLPRQRITPQSAEARSTLPAKLARMLTGDLANITLKSIAADPRRRYGSVEELANDLRNYLDGRPVLARRGTLAYRFSKFVRRNRVAMAMVAVATLAISAPWMWQFIHRQAATSPHPSIAVLPFTGPNAGEYLRSGLTEEITDALSRIKGLKVIARASAAQAAAKGVGAREAGRALHVTHVLESSLERSGDQIIIVSSLARTADGVRLWTDTYQRTVADIGAIETNLQARIIASLGLASSPQNKHVVPDQAHDLYLKARLEDNQGTAETNMQAQQDFRRALEIDPEYADAYAGLASAMWNRNAQALERPDWTELRKVEQLLQRAIQLDNGLARAHYGLGLYACQYDWDWNRAEREFQASLAAGPNAAGEFGLAVLYLILGKRQEADEHLRRARDLDPFSSSAASNAALALHLEGRLAEENEIYRQMASQYPGSFPLQVQGILIDADKGKPGTAIAKLRKLAERHPLAQLALASAEASTGHRADALRDLAPLERDYQKGRIPMFQFACIHATLGDQPGTVRWLERSMEAREAGVTHIRVEPAFARMQETPEFRALKRRMGLPQ